MSFQLRNILPYEQKSKSDDSEPLFSSPPCTAVCGMLSSTSWLPNVVVKSFAHVKPSAQGPLRRTQPRKNRLSSRKVHLSSAPSLLKSTAQHSRPTSKSVDSYSKADWIRKLTSQKDGKSRELTDQERAAFLARKEQREEKIRTLIEYLFYWNSNSDIRRPNLFD